MKVKTLIDLLERVDKEDEVWMENNQHDLVPVYEILVRLPCDEGGLGELVIIRTE